MIVFLNIDWQLKEHGDAKWIGNTRMKSIDLQNLNICLNLKLALFNGESSVGGEIDSEEAKRSPLSPNFSLLKRGSRKLGDNSDRKNDS